MTDTLIACLPMYDRPEVAASTDRLWAGIRDALRRRGQNASQLLTRSDDLWQQWESPALVFGQTCGMPFRMRLHRLVRLVGTPDYGLPDAPPGHYYSVLVTRAGDSAGIAGYVGRTLAFNSPDSQSGWAAPQNHLAAIGLPPFSRTRRTGAHRLSAVAVAEGRADIAAIDAVTWRFLVAYDADVARQLQVIGRTAPTPGLPCITARADPAIAAEAAAEAIGALAGADRTALGIRGFVRMPVSAYLEVPTPPPSQDAPDR